MKDCVISAENKKGAKIEDFQIDVDTGEFPGGEGKFIEIGDNEYKLENPISLWCVLKITDSQIIIRDGIMNNPHHGVNRRLIEKHTIYLREKCGGEVRAEITRIEAEP